MDVWCYPERKDRDEDDQMDVWRFPERKTEMRMIRGRGSVVLP